MARFAVRGVIRELQRVVALRFRVLECGEELFAHLFGVSLYARLRSSGRGRLLLLRFGLLGNFERAFLAFELRLDCRGLAA